MALTHGKKNSRPAVTLLLYRHDVASLNLSFPMGKIPSEFSRKIRQHYYAATSYIDDLVGQVLEAAAKADNISGYLNFVLLPTS